MIEKQEIIFSIEIYLKMRFSLRNFELSKGIVFNSRRLTSVAKSKAAIGNQIFSANVPTGF